MKIKSKLLLTPSNFVPSFKDWSIQGVLNPAAIRLPNKKIVLYVRVAESHGQDISKKNVTCPIMTSESEFKSEKVLKKNIVRKDRSGILFLKDGSCRLPTLSHFKKVILNEDGFKIESIEEKPAFVGKPKDGDYGVEDPRIVKIGKDYLMTYVNVSKDEGVSTSLAISKDLINWKRMGIIFPEQNKDVIFFPEKINGNYVVLHRPEGNFEFSKPSVWIGYSKDLIYWGKTKAIMHPRKDSWEESRIGGGTPPIKTKKGWLCIYHGVKVIIHERTKDETGIYSAGAVLFDLKNPEKILARTSIKKPLFKPQYSYEKKGFIGNVIFPTGIVETLDKKSVLLYCGGADTNIVVKEIKIDDILKSLEWG